MTNYLEYLQTARQTPDAIWNTFIIEYKHKRDFIFIFHEGDDDPTFYQHHLKINLLPNTTLKFFRSGNKDNVFKHMEQFKTKYPKNVNVIFMIDKDYDDILKINRPTYERLYTTSYYSIENFLCCHRVIESWAIYIAGLSTTGDTVSKITESYQRSRQQLIEISIPLMALLIAAKRHQKNVNLNNIDFNKIIKMNHQLIPELRTTKKEAQDYLIKTTNITIPISEEMIKNEIKIIKDLCNYTWMRGKQDVWFLALFINTLIDQIKTTETPIKTPIPINPKHLFLLFSHHIDTPPCLISFLNHLKTYLSPLENQGRVNTDNI